MQPFAVEGMCFGYFPRFTYNPDIQECEEFVYGGCGGNLNSFEEKAECEDLCKGVWKVILILYSNL